MVQVVKPRLERKTKSEQKSSDDPRKDLKVKGHSKFEACIPHELNPSERKLYLNRLYEKRRPPRYGSRRKKRRTESEAPARTEVKEEALKEVKEENQEDSDQEEVLKEVKEENQEDNDLEQDDHAVQPPLLFSDTDAEFYDPPKFPQGNRPATEHDSAQTDTGFSSSSSCNGCSDLTTKLEAMRFEKSKMASNCSELTTKLEAIECEKGKMASQFSELTAKLEAIECEKGKMSSQFSELTAKLEAIECERSRLARKVEWYEQVRDWVQSGGERLVRWMVENGNAPPALVWGGVTLFRGKMLLSRWSNQGFYCLADWVEPVWMKKEPVSKSVWVPPCRLRKVRWRSIAVII